MANGRMTARLICGPEGIRGLLVPMLNVSVPAGLPASVREALDRTALFNLMVRNPEDTYALQAQGDSMIGAKIDSGNILIVDRVIPKRINSIIVADIDGEYTVKRYEYDGPNLYLVGANPSFERIKVKSHQECKSWGVVTYVIKDLYNVDPDAEKPLPPDV